MTLCEAIFIVLFLASVMVAIAVFLLAVTRRKAAAWRMFLGMGAVWCVYFVILVASNLMARPRVTAAGEDRCFDEMCFAVVKAQTLSSLPVRPDRALYVITVRATSHSRSRTQAEGGLRARLYADGKYFAVSAQAQQAYELEHGKGRGLSQRLAPGESIRSVVVFEVPQSVMHPGLTLDHGFTPGYFVLGESPFFRGPDIITLPEMQ